MSKNNEEQKQETVSEIRDPLIKSIAEFETLTEQEKNAFRAKNGTLTEN